MRRILLISIWMIAIAIAVRLHADQRRPLAGASAAAMGGALVAIADESSAVAWNPAGLSRIRRYVASNDHASLFGIATFNRLTLLIPVSERTAYGIGWDRLSLADAGPEFTRDEIRMGYSFSLSSRLSLGLSLKYLADNAAIDGRDLGSSHGWGSDIGVISVPETLDGVVLGVVVEDFLGIAGGKLRSGLWANHSSGNAERIFPAQVKVSAAKRLGESVLLSVQVDDSFRLGVDLLLGPVHFRGGAARSFDETGVRLSAGFGLTYGGVRFDYASLFNNRLPMVSVFSASVGADFQNPPVKIEAVILRDIYPVNLHYYLKRNGEAPVFQIPMREVDRSNFKIHPLDSVGRIWLTNDSRELVNVRVKLFLDRFTPDEGAIVIDQINILPEHTASIPLRRLPLVTDVVRHMGHTPVEAKIEVNDIDDEIRKKAFSSAKTVIHSINSVLMDDVAKLASFISSTDPIVRELALSVEDISTSLSEETGINESLVQAVSLFELIHGMSYASDPNIPFESGAVDEVKFPRQMISAAAQGRPAFGDCDDTTVLYCSLLESVGIHTALIKQPKHVLMAFQLDGLSLEDAQSIGLDDQHYLPIDGYVWIPVETTLIGKGFANAWKGGLEQLGNGIVDLTTTQNAWEKFGSVDASAIFDEPEFYSVPPKDRMMKKVRETLTDSFFAEWRTVK